MDTLSIFDVFQGRIMAESIDRLCLLLAFQTIVSKDGSDAEAATSKILALAKQMKDFCDLYAPRGGKGTP